MTDDRLQGPDRAPDIDLTEDDVREAMAEIPGYLDITPGDFQELYRLALRHAWQRLRRSMTTREVMTAPVVAVRPESPLDEVAERMARARVSGVPVVDASERVVGVVSEADFLSRMSDAAGRSFLGVIARCLRGKGCPAASFRGRTAADIMSSPPVTVLEDTPITEVAALMTASHVNRVPVVSRQGRLVGIVSRADLIRAHLG